MHKALDLNLKTQCIFLQSQAQHQSVLYSIVTVIFSKYKFAHVYYRPPSHPLKTFKWGLMALQVKYKLLNVAYNNVHVLALPTSSVSITPCSP